MKQGEKAKQFILHLAWIYVISETQNLKNTFQKYTRRFVPRGGVVKDVSGWYALITEQGSSASHMTAAKALDVISRPSRIKVPNYPDFRLSLDNIQELVVPLEKKFVRTRLWRIAVGATI